ncbi:MAG: formyltransferase family protein [Clostridia bacterium]|nr:formyltransferase family protein [Clostridia bacterium]
MKLCIAGKNNIAVNSLDYIITNRIVDRDQICAIPNNCDTGLDGWQLSLKGYCNKNNIRIVSLEEIYDNDDILFLSLEFEKLIRTFKFKSNKLFNIHFSKLPKYRGMYTSAWPILNGETVTGVTLHKIDDGIDTGDIIDQIDINIDINYTSRDLYFKYNEEGYNLLVRNIHKLIEANYSAFKQSNEDASYYSKKSINYKELNINFSTSALEIHNQLRAFIFKEYQLPTVNGQNIEKSCLTNRKATLANKIIEHSEYFEISGTDKYIVIAYKAN